MLIRDVSFPGGCRAITGPAGDPRFWFAGVTVPVQTPGPTGGACSQCQRWKALSQTSQKNRQDRDNSRGIWKRDFHIFKYEVAAKGLKRRWREVYLQPANRQNLSPPGNWQRSGYRGARAPRLKRLLDTSLTSVLGCFCFPSFFCDPTASFPDFEALIVTAPSAGARRDSLLLPCLSLRFSLAFSVVLMYIWAWTLAESLCLSASSTRHLYDMKVYIPCG